MPHRLHRLARVVLVAAGVAASAPDRVRAQDRAPGSGLDLPVREVVLDNGMRFLLLPRPGAPTVAFVVEYAVGGVDEFPGRFVRELAMVKDAADEVGAELDMDLGAIADDRDVVLLAGKLEALAKDEQFREAMAREVEEDMAEDGATMAVAVMAPEDDTDEMFMARA